MQSEKEHKEKEKRNGDRKDDNVKSDPGTTNTTDPQENMEGPVSSLLKKVGEGFDDKDAKKKSGKDKNS